jgi:hypothetical protein
MRKSKREGIQKGPIPTDLNRTLPLFILFPCKSSNRSMESIAPSSLKASQIMNVLAWTGTFEMCMDRDGHDLQTSAIDVVVALALSIERLENEWAVAVG